MGFIKQVTVTGADESIQPITLRRIHEEYPFVEFGILVSKDNSGNSPRFPSQEWLEELRQVKVFPMQLSMHLCGSWVRNLCLGNSEVFHDWISEYFTMFDRIQLNFHGYPHRAGDKFIAMLKEGFNVPIIFQLDGQNDSLYDWAKYKGVNAQPLYDLSGGAGLLPEHWQSPKFEYTGYAGGLSPENLKENLQELASMIDVPHAQHRHMIWIDAETYLRSEDNTVFSIAKVTKFLDIAKPYIVEA